MKASKGNFLKSEFPNAAGGWMNKKKKKGKAAMKKAGSKGKTCPTCGGTGKY